MRGHEPIIAMRMAGKTPRSVALMLFPAQPWVTDWHKHPSTQGDATVVLDERDTKAVSRLDLRFLVGLDPVIVNGPHNEVTTKVADACLEAGAARVLAVYFDLSKPEHEQIVGITDRMAEVAHG